MRWERYMNQTHMACTIYIHDPCNNIIKRGYDTHPHQHTSTMQQTMPLLSCGASRLNHYCLLSSALPRYTFIICVRDVLPLLIRHRARTHTRKFSTAGRPLRHCSLVASRGLWPRSRHNPRSNNIRLHPFFFSRSGRAQLPAAAAHVRALNLNAQIISRDRESAFNSSPSRVVVGVTAPFLGRHEEPKRKKQTRGRKPRTSTAVFARCFLQAHRVANSLGRHLPPPLPAPPPNITHADSKTTR